MKKITNKCMDCRIKIDKRSKRCHSCATKIQSKFPKNNPNWKGGISFIKSYCIDCGILLGNYAHYYNSKRCRSCATKKQLKNPKDNPFYGKHHSLKTKRKLRLYNIGKKHSIETKNKIRLSSLGRKHSEETKAKLSFLRRGKNNPAYIDGNSNLPYPIKFNDKLKYQIRQRDNFKCKNCSMTEEEHIIIFGKVLHIHHINYNKLNIKKRNLITLCFYCNTRANFNRKFWKEHYIEKIKEIYNDKSIIYTSV